jgi:hypothetical protein
MGAGDREGELRARIYPPGPHLSRAVRGGPGSPLVPLGDGYQYLRVG